jgi:hypothetical protein
VSECDLEDSIMGRTWSIRGFCALGGREENSIHRCFGNYKTKVFGFVGTDHIIIIIINIQGWAI